MTEILEWTNEQVIRLIGSYRSRGMLWDPGHDLYRVQTAKYEAWCELSELYGCEIADLRKKFNSIFASHRREKAKIRLGGRSTWFLYNHLSFLPSHMTNEDPQTTTRTKREPTREASTDETVEERLDEPSSELEDFDDRASLSPVHIIVKEEPEIIQSAPKYYRKPAPVRVHKRRAEKAVSKKKVLLESKLLKRSKLYKKKDECDSFGEYIAISLRKHDERTRSMIKQAINNILFEQEMKKYNSGQFAVMYAGVDENPLIVPEDCEK